METKSITNPSTHALICPKCQHNDFRVLGTKGASGAAISSTLLLGAIGNLMADSSSRNDFSLKPIQYKCNVCGNKFVSLPLEAEPEEILEMPCTVSFKRMSSFIGMAVAQNVWLNGVKVDSIGNGKTITFKTKVKHNIVFVTDQYGVAFKDVCKFEAESGGTKELRFKRKFL